MLKKDYGLIFWLHMAVILLYISTPFWLAWQWILILVIIFYLQNIFFKNCVLTKAQLDGRADIVESEKSFYVYYFKKWHFPFDAKWVKKYFAWTLLWTIFSIAIVYQLILNQNII